MVPLIRQVGQILSNFVIEQFVLTFDYASLRLAPVEMFVSSNPRRRSFPQGSLLKRGCGVSLTELCLTTIRFPWQLSCSRPRSFMDYLAKSLGVRTFLRIHIVIFDICSFKSEFRSQLPDLQKYWEKTIFKCFLRFLVHLYWEFLSSSNQFSGMQYLSKIESAENFPFQNY